MNRAIELSLKNPTALSTGSYNIVTESQTEPYSNNKM